MPQRSVTRTGVPQTTASAAVFPEVLILRRKNKQIRIAIGRPFGVVIIAGR